MPKVVAYQKGNVRSETSARNVQAKALRRAEAEKNERSYVTHNWAET